jgi:hypothetical protein
MTIAVKGAVSLVKCYVIRTVKNGGTVPAIVFGAG